MKILVTHINPHLDDIAAIWLIKKFFPDFKNAKIEFISQSQTKMHEGKETEDRIYLGIGRGKYDEHKGDVDECATSLVWKDIKLKKLSPKDEFEGKALDELVRWSLLLDTAQMPIGEFDDFSVESFIRSHKNDPTDSLRTVDLGCEILDRILPVLIKKQKALVDWEKRIEFNSRLGKVAAVESDYVSQEIAYQEGFQVVILKGKKREFIGIFAPGTSDVDLTPIYVKLSEMEPQAGWYLHHGKKMVLCGASSAPDAVKSKLSLQEVIDVVKSL